MRDRGRERRSIGAAQANDLSRVLGAAPIEAVFCTGAKSAELYGRLCEPATGMAAVRLPSTSPANATWGFNDLVEAYRPIAAHEHPFAPPVLDVPQVVGLERAIAAAGTPLAELMDRAGLALAHRAHALAPEARVAVLCGSGNNGGDGWVAAADLAARGHGVTLVTSRAPAAIKAQPARDAAKRAERELHRASATIALNPGDAQLEETLAQADMIVDAVLGTGFDGDCVKEPYATWIRLANRRRGRGALIVAADVPSGLSAQTGRAAEPSIRADATVTMIVPKPGLGPSCGTVHVAPLAYIEPLLSE